MMMSDLQEDVCYHHITILVLRDCSERGRTVDGVLY